MLQELHPIIMKPKVAKQEIDPWVLVPYVNFQPCIEIDPWRNLELIGR